jgi:putative PIN family toxin of toxin-antitoxin system
MSFDRRIVVDTGVLISAAIRPQSIPALALEKALLLFEVCASRSTLAELQRVLMAERFERYRPLASREQFLEGFVQRARRFEVSITVTDCRDPGDNQFLELAETAEAELIVSTDTDLQVLHPWRGIPILPPSAFLLGVR